MKKNLLFALSLMVMAAMLLAACAPAATPAPAAPAEPAAPAVEPTKAPEAAVEPTKAPEAPAEVALRWRTRPDNQAEIDLYSSISQDLDASLEGITLAYEPGGSESSSYQDVLKTEIANGTAPDVFWIPGTDVADFAKRGLIMDLKAMADKTEGFKTTDFYEGPMFHMTFSPTTNKAGDALWGLPRDVSTFVLYLNLDLIAEAGADDPRELAKEGKWDWEAFLDVAKKVTALGSDIYGYGANAWWGPYGVWLNAAGGGFFNEDRTACALDTDASIAGLEFERKLYVDEKVAVPYGEDSEPPFMAGKVAMFQNGRWATPGVRANAKFNWDVVELPTGANGQGNWLFWGAYVVNAKTAHPEEAWKLVQALTTAETQGKISALGANIPSRVSQEAFDAFLTFTPPANNQAFLNGIDPKNKPTAEGPLWAGSWPDYDAVMGPMISSVMNGEMTIEDFKAKICTEANKAFAQ
ncbi:ABC transporter substrate-binding protein [Levilinea saccharolytica]|uniref:Sugar ABC transporter substrate-binding protein n=2 Tax=Levilinea saccharolytica TaxID=229921 RepID=A0A0P6Y8D0_9CHLR|nr:sugar ABC transporter substrate-binding protein [Levilinea saccharolytica]KPL77936.1 hypothetical protein ADN01_15255 [Levilinea saccharolytica]